MSSSKQELVQALEGARDEATRAQARVEELKIELRTAYPDGWAVVSGEDPAILPVNEEPLEHQWLKLSVKGGRLHVAWEAGAGMFGEESFWTNPDIEVGSEERCGENIVAFFLTEEEVRAYAAR